MEKHGGIKIIRGALLALALIVFLGNIMMWIVMPTDFYYNKWVPQIMAHTDSSYLGLQGPIMLDFTFPILFIAVLGCIYIHLGKQLSEANDEGSRKPRFKSLRKPMIIKGLGIVNWIELSLFAMFVCLLVWYFSAFLHSWYEKVAFLALARGDKVWEVKLERLGLVLGLAGNLCLTFLFYPVTRGSSILPLLGLTSEATIKYHTWLGHMAMSFFTAHGILYILYWIMTNRASMMITWYMKMDQLTYVSNIAGEIALLCGLALWITTYPSIRRKMFELFFYTHYLYIPFIIFFILHLGIFFPCIMLPGFYLFLVDRYLRFLQSRQKVRLVSARILPCETVELNFAKIRGLSYTPTSTMFVNVPSISKLQWHPFTVSSNSNLEPETITVVIKSEGSWTKSLYETLSSPAIDHLEVSVEGPYGPAQIHFLRHDTLVMVSGGSGITPFISIIRELIFVSTKLRCKTPKIQLISVFKNSSHLSMLDLLFPVSGVPSEASDLDLQIEAYVTREKVHPTEKLEPVRTVWFKPLASDAPLSSTLGQNNWLWLAMIISSSFIMFLLLIGIVTQYYIYPIDHNTYRIDLTSKRALLNMLFICISIAVTATAAFLFNKKKNDRQIQDRNKSANVTSLSSAISGVDHELESLPRQSFIKSTRVHYGHRPDLKSILIDRKGSNVGVLVSGPKEMRHDVAKICSSGLADNLHFQSISFNW